ncbi:hypothetical protein DENSPDRAFT_842969 [Dentipellis sp. KUC8613]|nr:hypothetical protein DENSPDRAFT_842969 [Dentipellis sp. KUC8613]
MVSDNLSTHVPFSSTYRRLDVIKEKMCVESCGAYVGPMDPMEFLSAFVPSPSALDRDGQQRKMPTVSFEKMLEAKEEPDMYPIYIKICKQLDEDHIMRYYDTHSQPDPCTVPLGAPDRDGLSPDIMTFHKDRLPKVEARTDFSRAERADEFKFKNNVDPFDDTPNKSDYPFESCSQDGKKTRGQITAYAAAMLELQFRTFVFSVLVMGEYARLIRWDRSGAIVTRAFNYQKDPEPLAQFLWRYNFLTRAQRGFDESVKVIETTDVTIDSDRAYEELKKYIGAHAARNPEMFLLRMTPLGVPPPASNNALPRRASSPSDASFDGYALPSDGSESLWDGSESLWDGPPSPSVGPSSPSAGPSSPSVGPSSPSIGPSSPSVRPSSPSTGPPLPSDPPALPADQPTAPPAKSYYVHEEASGDGWDYYVLAPRMSDRGPFGRATRSLYVYDRCDEQVRHLKDTNRIISHSHTVEHEIIDDLNAKNVPHISTVHAAWDVAPRDECYDSVTPMFCDDGKINPRFAPPDVRHRRAQRLYRAYRLITQELGMPLWKFRNWKQAVQAMIDILEALDGAEEAGWRHRDVSVGNIMIHNDRGLLIDWDACQKSVEMNCEDSTRVPDLTGTWQFISMRRLRNGNGLHEARDDLESVFWVLLWLAFNFSDHSLSPDALRNRLTEIFDDCKWENGHYRGGGGKDLLFGKEDFALYLEVTFSPPGLQDILKSLHRIFRITPPLEPYIKGLSKERAEDTLATYKRHLVYYKEDLARLKDSTYFRDVLADALKEFEWPSYGPIEHDIPLDLKGAQVTPTWKTVWSSSIPARTIAQNPPSFSKPPPSGAKVRTKMRRTGEQSEQTKRQLRTLMCRGGRGKGVGTRMGKTSEVCHDHLGHDDRRSWSRRSVTRFVLFCGRYLFVGRIPVE